MTNTLSNAALTSWVLNPFAIVFLVASAFVYIRGWARGRHLLRNPADGQRLAAFLFGMLVLFLATESPLDAFDSLFLSAHMTQHLLLMMVAPPLVLFAHPVLPLLRGLPKKFVKEGLGPFLTWQLLRRGASWLVLPPVAWTAFALSMVLWHLPKFYELALRSPVWHGFQHACFFWTGILFWWPVIEPGPGRSKWPEWSKIPYLLFADIVNTALSAFFVFSGRILYPSYQTMHTAGLSVRDDQTVAGLIMWVPGSVIYLLPAFVIVMRLFAPIQANRSPTLDRVPGKQPRRKRLIGALASSRRLLQGFMLLLAIIIMLDGWLGPQITPLNLAGVLPWIHWRALSVLALLTVGNLFCMSCPFTLVRDIARKVLPARLRWPRYLRNKWLPAALLVLYFWCYEAFSLWDSPSLTAWIILGYFGAALLIDGFFRGASFCKYVCPIGQFQFVSSLISPREIKIRSKPVCQSCRTYDCIRGNEHTRGCELYLFQPKKESNLDCTFCLDCVNACPHENIGLLAVLPAETLVQDSYRSSIGKLSRRTDLAALVLVFVFGAFANAAGMVSPVTAWERVWHARLGTNTMPVIIAALVLACVVVLPGLVVLTCGALNRLAVCAERRSDVARRLVFTFVPLGFAMWAAHLLYHFATGWSAGWTIVDHRFLGAQGPLTMSLLPTWLTGAQILILDAGLLLTLVIGWRIARQVAGRVRSAIGILTPWAVVAVALYSAGVWIFFEPMQMRGTMQ